MVVTHWKQKYGLLFQWLPRHILVGTFVYIIGLIFIEDIHPNNNPKTSRSSINTTPSFCREYGRNKCCYPGNSKLRLSPCIRHMGLKEMGIELAASSSAFWTTIHWTMMDLRCGCIVASSYRVAKEKLISVSLKVNWDSIANLSVFEWNPSSTGFCGLVDSFDSVTRGFSMSLISIRL